MINTTIMQMAVLIYKEFGESLDPIEVAQLLYALAERVINSEVDDVEIDQ